LRTPASIIGAFRSVWETWCRRVVSAAVAATRAALRPRADEQTDSDQGMSTDDGAQWGSLQIRRPTEAAPCSTQTRQPLAIGVGRPFLTFRYQAAPGCVVPADRVA
jgi:hypothetical protein